MAAQLPANLLVGDAEDDGSAGADGALDIEVCLDNDLQTLHAECSS